jgi:tRNA threonylcarbamoyladenosine dehydratase
MNKETDWKSRTSLLLGDDALKKLNDVNILIAGLGGVGAYAAEYLCRAGVGGLTIIDGDKVDPSNRNRQLPALVSTTGKRKAKIMEARLRDINPEVDITPIDEFIRDERIPEILQSESFDYVIDAIDSLSPKLHLILNCLNLKLKLISSMGAGGKIDPSQVKVADISKSYNCGLARALRKRLHRRGIYKGVKVVFSPEERKSAAIQEKSESVANTVVGTVSYMPSVFGCYCAAEVINHFVKE